MILRPWMFGGRPEVVEVPLADGTAEEMTERAIDSLLDSGRGLQQELSLVPVEDRLRVLQELGEAWAARTADGELDGVRSSLLVATGYSEKNIALEMELVPRVLSAGALSENLDRALPGGIASADSFVPLGREGEVRNVPAGPVLIMASGNSLVPAVIPAAISMALGNLTVIKPSSANYGALIEVFAPLGDLAHSDPAAGLMARALGITYFAHDSPRLTYLLEHGGLGTVNYWGGGAGRTRVASAVVRNPNQPRFFSNGPLTGMAMVSAGAGERAARGLAVNMVLYEQQLCSSPTTGAFIGTMDGARAFAGKVARELEDFGSQHRIESGDDLMFLRSSALRVMELCGSHILSSRDCSNPWAIAVSAGAPNLDLAVSSFPSFGVHARRRFIELVVVDDIRGAAELMATLPSRPSFQGVDKVQTVGTALTAGELVEARSVLPNLGVYRVVPVEDMYVRDAAEPYDGQFLASLFSQAVYHRPGGGRP